MSIRKIIIHPHDVLRKKAVTVSNFHKQLHRLIDDMIDTVKHHDGVGLAAPQVGISKRIIVINTEEDGLLEMVNPEILEHKGDQPLGFEGCLSIPKVVASIPRYDSINIQGQDRNGEPIEMTATGFLARVFQHEIDHLDGVLILDRAESTFTTE